MKEISLNEYKKILMSNMKFLDKICRDNDIKYSVIGGTAIGAVRHKGFIPWDDDIDIILSHEDYNKLRKVLQRLENDKYFLLDENSVNNYYPFMKLIDKRTVIKEEGQKNIKEYGIFIDIFEYNGAPNSKFLQFIYYYKIIFWKKLIAGLSWDKKRKDHKIILFFRYFVANLFGKKFLFKHYNKLCHKYNNKKSNYLVSNWPAYGLKKEIQKKSNFIDFKDIVFENYKLMVSSNIDEILKTTFNNYMKIPPREKQVSNHKMKAYWKN